MISTPRNDEARVEPGRVGEANNNQQIELCFDTPQPVKPPRDTKLERIRAALRLPGGLNTFEAQRLGDTCLHTTVAKLREQGEVILSEWEVVPSRFSADGARVKRYRSSGLL